MYVTKEEIAQARSMDLLTYLQTYEPNELVHVRGDVYCTRTHDSLKISNGLWNWWSRGIGGATALDYLITVRGMALPEAVSVINRTPISLGGRTTVPPPNSRPPPKPFALPPAYTDSRRVFAYLCSRGIDPEIINHCLKHGLLYEEAEHHNAVFVGLDAGGTPRYATMRSTNSSSTFLRDVEGSDKRHCFCLPASTGNIAAFGGIGVFLFESAIDALSHATLDKRAGRDWHSRSRLSLGGIYQRSKHKDFKPFLALEQYLADQPQTTALVLCLDADEAGREASALIASQYPQLQVWERPPKQGKDYNELLQLVSGIASRAKTRGRDCAERAR